MTFKSYTLSCMTTLIALTVSSTCVTMAATSRPYIVRPADTLYKISVAKGVTLKAIEAANPQIKNFADIWAGESINVPVSGASGTKPTVHRKSTATVRVSEIIAHAKTYLGIPYVWGGSHPNPGFDCSGFVQYVFGQCGITLPRQSHDQATIGKPVSRNALKPGDLLFFANTDSYAALYANHVTHVGIYIGHDAMIESSSTHHDEGVVVIRNVFSNPFYKTHYYGARNVISP